MIDRKQAKQSRIMLGNEKMEEVSEFKYLGTVLCKHGGMEGEIRASDER